MAHSERIARKSLNMTAVLAASGLAGCAGRDSLSGRWILDDLERSHVSLTAEAGGTLSVEPGPELPATGSITLADLLRAAEARNPAIAFARSGVGVAAGRAWQASLYPNPRGDVAVEDLSGRDGVSSSKATIGITQPIILGKRRQAAMDAADAERAVRSAEVEERRRALFGEVAVEHAQLVAIREQERLHTELRILAQQTLASAQTRFEARAAPETDVIRPRVEMHRIDAALARLAQQRIAAERHLTLLLGGVAIDFSRVDGELPMTPPSLDLDHLQAAILASHPRLTVADHEIEGASARLARVEAEVTPDLDVRLAAGYDAGLGSGVVEVGAGMTIPLWDRRQGDTLSARFDLMRARQQRDAAENEVLAALSAAAGEYEAARVQLDMLRDNIVPDAQRAFEQTVEAYRAGRSTFLDLLDSQRTFTEARGTMVDLASAVAAARAKVLQVVGPEGLRSTSESMDPKHKSQVPSNFKERPQGAEVTP